MTPSPVPFVIVPCSICFYTQTHHALTKHNVFNNHPRPAQARVKAISAAHAALTTLLVLYALRRSPAIKIPDGKDASTQGSQLPDGNLDDSSNPLIQDRNAYANLITMWETGYLIYDTFMLVQGARTNRPSAGFAEKALSAAKRNPAIFAHHTLLAAAFLALQAYIVRGRERGIWVILVFMLMNASNPVMHARWWARTSAAAQKSSSRTARVGLLWDVAFAAAFAGVRFGSVAWLFRRYGHYHGLGAWEVFGKLRVPCRVGTGLLTGLNALWWAALVRGIWKRRNR